MAGRLFVVGCMFVGLAPVCSPRAAAAESGSPQAFPGPRILHFPADWPLGSLVSRPARPEEPTYVSHYWLRDGDWELLGEARGDVVVPAGHQIALSVSRLREWRDLSPLLKLHPDDLYRLAIHGSYSGGSKPGDSCMEYVAHLTGLRALDLHNTNISGAAMKHVSGLKGLLWLTVPGRMDDKGMALIAGLPTLRGLYIKENRITDAGLTYLAKLSTLEELELGGEKITDDGLAHLAALPHLKYLALWGKSFTNDGFKYLKDIPGIEILDFGILRQTADVGLAHIAEIPQVTELDFYWSKNITDEGLSHLKKLPQLRKLNIGWAKVTDAGMINLQAIPTLECLTLPPMGVTDKGLQYLCELPRLREIHLQWMQHIDPNMNKDGYTDEGIKALSKCTSLEHLSIGGDGLTDDGLIYLAELPRLSNLTLAGHFTDAGLIHLQKLQDLGLLDFMSGANFTPRALSDFRASMPNLVTYGDFEKR